ncbi:MAG: hypothetical protein Q8O54_02435, partial [Brevundimonas sp.]|nr:hypothetical protein [Brevundimonas sp.]
DRAGQTARRNGRPGNRGSGQEDQEIGLLGRFMVRCKINVASHKILAYIVVIGSSAAPDPKPRRLTRNPVFARDDLTMTTTAKTSKPGKSAGNPFEAFTFPAPTFEVPAAFRDLAEKSVSTARDTYAKIKSATDDATGLVEESFETAREVAFAIGVMTLDAAKSNSDASFEFARDLFGAKTVSEMIETGTAISIVIGARV